MYDAAQVAATIRRAAPNAWLAVVVPPGAQEGTIASLKTLLADELQTVEFAHSISDESHWSQIELARDHTTAGKKVLVLTPDEVGSMRNYAPSTASLVNVLRMRTESDDTLVDVEERLASFRTRAGWSDEELIAAVETGKLVVEPWIAEWLILLGRSDLVGRS